MCDGIFISSRFSSIESNLDNSGNILALEREQVDDFFTQSLLARKPVVRRFGSERNIILMYAIFSDES